MAYEKQLRSARDALTAAEADYQSTEGEISAALGTLG